MEIREEPHRVELHYEGKPARKHREILKTWGFKWDQEHRCWWRAPTDRTSKLLAHRAETEIPDPVVEAYREMTTVPEPEPEPETEEQQEFEELLKDLPPMTPEALRDAAMLLLYKGKYPDGRRCPQPQVRASALNFLLKLIAQEKGEFEDIRLDLKLTARTTTKRLTCTNCGNEFR